MPREHTLIPLQRWLDASTPQQKTTLARLAKVHENMLFQWAGFRRSMRPESARALERASQRMHTLARGDRGLPVLRREELCETCNRCEYAKAARNLRRAA